MEENITTRRHVIHFSNFKHLGTILTNEYRIYVETKGRMNSRNLLSFGAEYFYFCISLSKNMYIKTYRTIILTAFVSVSKLDAHIAGGT